LPAGDRARMLQAGMFGGPTAFAPVSRIFAKNGGFGWNGVGLVSSIVIDPTANTHLAGIANTNGAFRTRGDDWSQYGIEMQDALIDGLARMHSRPDGLFSIRARNDGTANDMCINITQAAMGDQAPGGGDIPAIPWNCGSPVAAN